MWVIVNDLGENNCHLSICLRPWKKREEEKGPISEQSTKSRLVLNSLRGGNLTILRYVSYTFNVLVPVLDWTIYAEAQQTASTMIVGSYKKKKRRGAF